MRQSRSLAALALIGAVLGTACSSDNGTDPGAGGITLNIAATTLSIAQGATGNVGATIARTGSFTGAVAITVTGLPANVTAVANPASIAAGSTTSTITFTAAAGAAAGNSTVTVSASGTGVTTQTRTLTLTITAVTAAGYTIALNPTALTIAQNAQSTTTATLTRTGGFAGNVTFAFTAPAGITVTFNPTQTTANTTTATIAVGAAVATGVQNVTIRGTATGLTDRTVVLPVTVTTGGGGGAGIHRVCGLTLLFAAFQDGTGAWTASPIVAGNSFNFTINSARGAVAYVFAGSGTNNTVRIRYGTPTELNGSGIVCPTLPTTKTVNGSVAGVTNPLETAAVSIGTGFTIVVPLVSSNFSITNVPNFATDLLAGRLLTTIVGSSATVVMNKGIIRRNINPAAGSTIPVLDFNAAESFTPTTRTLTLANLGADLAMVSVSFLTNSVAANLAFTTLFGDGAGSNTATRQYPAVPTTVAGDLHVYSIATAPVAGASRFITAYFRDGLDRTVTLGPALNAVTVTTAATAPAPRLRAAFTIQNEYNAGTTVNYNQTAGGILRSYDLGVSQGYLAGSTAFDFTIPDFTVLTGWQAAWNLVVGTQVQWGVTGTGGNLTVLDGGVGTTATRSATITP